VLSAGHEVRTSPPRGYDTITHWDEFLPIIGLRSTAGLSRRIELINLTSLNKLS